MARSLFIIMLLAVSSVLSSEAKDVSATRLQWLQQHFQNVQAAREEPDKAIKFVFGNDIWQPGKQFESGNHWLAFVCREKTCTFEPASLQVSDEEWQGHYDDHPSSGQRLSFKRNQASSGEAMAWFDAGTTRERLSSGLIPSYYINDGKRLPSGNETLEITIDLPGGDHSKFVPMLLTAEQASALSGQEMQASFWLQLRAQGQRQLLPGELGSCSHSVNRDYLLWAGDMDKDGLADYLVSYVDADGPVHLYLSSMRKPGQLVGLAGIHWVPPYGGECDGFGWLE